jgi:hypothetical protein
MAALGAEPPPVIEFCATVSAELQVGRQIVSEFPNHFQVEIVRHPRAGRELEGNQEFSAQIAGKVGDTAVSATPNLAIDHEIPTGYLTHCRKERILLFLWDAELRNAQPGFAGLM